MPNYFFSDPPNILPCEGTGIGYKYTQIKVFGTTYASSFCYRILYP